MLAQTAKVPVALLLVLVLRPGDKALLGRTFSFGSHIFTVLRALRFAPGVKASSYILYFFPGQLWVERSFALLNFFYKEQDCFKNYK